MIMEVIALYLKRALLFFGSDPNQPVTCYIYIPSHLYDDDDDDMVLIFITIDLHCEFYGITGNP